MKFISNTLLELDRELSDLDQFALEFLNILKKYTSYVIVSGYVAILLGRARASEDIDVIIPKISFPTFQSLAQELHRKGFYCLNAENESDIYDYLKENIPIRFAKKDKIIPNIELKQTKHRFDALALKKTILVKLPKGEMFISHLELQIAFKEAVLKSPKDREDARHLRVVAKGYIDEKMIQHYKEQLHEFFYKRESKREIPLR